MASGAGFLNLSCSSRVCRVSKEAIMDKEHVKGAADKANSPVTMSLFDQGISGAMMTSIAVSPSMAKMTATARVESD
jgi:hypothetical protein